jgi:hypothetical protein
LSSRRTRSTKIGDAKVCNAVEALLTKSNVTDLKSLVVLLYPPEHRRRGASLVKVRTVRLETCPPSLNLPHRGINQGFA